MSELFSEKNVFVAKERFKTKKAFFHHIARKAAELGYVHSEEDCYQGILQRESQQTTGFQDGFAIPHCKNNTVKEAKLLVFKTLPIPWDSLDGQPVVFAFVLLIPEKSAKEHLQYLAKIAKSLIDEQYRVQLNNANEKTIYSIIKQKLEI